MRQRTSQCIQTLLVDDHRVFLIGLAELLAEESDICVVGQAVTAAQAVEQARTAQPDVVLMDVSLPDRRGTDACREIRARWPHIKVVTLTSYDGIGDVAEAIMSGASAYVLKQSPPNELLAAIRCVAAGECYVDNEVAAGLFELVRGRQRATAPLDVLTNRERAIVPHVAEGRTNKEIADMLQVSPLTVKAHVSLILKKLRLQRRTQIVSFYMGLDEDPPRMA